MDYDPVTDTYKCKNGKILRATSKKAENKVEETERKLTEQVSADSKATFLPTNTTKPGDSRTVTATPTPIPQLPEEPNIPKMSAQELKKFMRDQNNIGKLVTFRATVFMINGRTSFEKRGAYCMWLEDGTEVYGVGLLDYITVFDGDDIEVCGVYEGTNNPYCNGWPYFTTVTLSVL